MPLPRIILIIVILNTVVALCCGTFIYLQISSMKEVAIHGADARADEPKGVSSFYPIEKLILNLPDQGREHYFVIDLALQIDDGTAHNELKNLEPLLRSMVIGSLSALGFTELRALSMAQVQARLDLALSNEFSARNLKKPFSNVLVSKLIVQ